MKIEGLCYVEDGVLTVALRSKENVFPSPIFDNGLYVQYNDVYPGQPMFQGDVSVIPMSDKGWVVKVNGEKVGEFIPVDGGVSFNF